jgi:hypothetical protein
MGYVDRCTHFCDKCNAPTLHRMFGGLSDGREYAILTCVACGNRAEGGVSGEDDDFDYEDES